MSLADGIAWEQEFGVSEASKAADARIRAQGSQLTGRDPMGVFPTPSSAADVPGYGLRETTAGAGNGLPFMPTVEMTPELRAEFDAAIHESRAKREGAQRGQAGGQTAKPKIEVQVYLDNGVVFVYSVETITSAREHASAIVAGGYRSVQAETPDVMTHYPPHRILKVKIKGAPVQTNYFDKALGT